MFALTVVLLAAPPPVRADESPSQQWEKEVESLHKQWDELYQARSKVFQKFMAWDVAHAYVFDTLGIDEKKDVLHPLVLAHWAGKQGILGIGNAGLARRYSKMADGGGVLLLIPPPPGRRNDYYSELDRWMGLGLIFSRPISHPELFRRPEPFRRK